MAAAGRLRLLLVLHLCLALTAGEAELGKESQVKVLSDDMWRELLQGEWMVEFYAPWCPACQKLQPEWENFAEWGEHLGVNVAKVDVMEQPELSGRFIIRALPTIYHCKDGEFRRYQGARTKMDLINFIGNQEWKSIEPVSSWLGPSSFLMSSMSALFQLSTWIRHCCGYLTEKVGIPLWGSYAVLALAAVFSALILGLLMVFLANWISPSKRHQPPQYPQPRKLSPEEAQWLQNLDEEQEAAEEDPSDDEAEAGEAPDGNSSPSSIRRRPVNPAAAADASQL